jgi:hypothetical protein
MRYGFVETIEVVESYTIIVFIELFLVWRDGEKFLQGADDTRIFFRLFS